MEWEISIPTCKPDVLGTIEDVFLQTRYYIQTHKCFALRCLQENTTNMHGSRGCFEVRKY
jgi:hypothetical protein